MPGLDPSSLTGAAWCRTDGYFDKPQARRRSVRRGRLAGGRRARDRRGDGRSRATATGWRLHIDAGERPRRSTSSSPPGYDSPPLLAPLGIDLPIVKEQRFLFLSRPVRERLLEPLLVSAERRFAAKQLANGRVLASDLRANGDPVREQEAWRRTVREGIEELTPMLSYVAFDLLDRRLLRHDARPRRDSRPRRRASRASGSPPASAATASCSRPRSGDALAAWIAGDDPGEPAASLMLDRFESGSLELETQVV